MWKDFLGLSQHPSMQELNSAVTVLWIRFITLRNAFTFLQNVSFNGPFSHFDLCMKVK